MKMVRALVGTLALASLGATALARPAQADSHGGLPNLSGMYVTFGIGGPITTKQDFDDTLFGQGSYEPDWGFGGLVEIGRYVGNDWRFGVAVNWVRGFDGELRLDDIPLRVDLEGHSDAVSVMFNLDHTICELDTVFGKIRPFVGGGLGFVYYDVQDFGGGGPGDKTDTAFAAALHLGYDMKLGEGLTLTSRYSVAFTGEAEFDQAAGATTTKDSEVDLLVFTGLRFDLN